MHQASIRHTLSRLDRDLQPRKRRNPQTNMHISNVLPRGKVISREETFRESISRLIGLALTPSSAWAVTMPQREHANWMYFEQDDFFYYLKNAQNLAMGHGSTFNGLVITNGYHPLWMLTLAAVIHLSRSVRFIPAFLAFSIWVATVVTFRLTHMLLKRGGVESLAASALSAYVAVYAEHVFCYGI